MMTAMERNADFLNKKLKSELTRLRTEREEAEKVRQKAPASEPAQSEATKDEAKSKPANES
jgi:hypothetical protein